MPTMKQLGLALHLMGALALNAIPARAQGIGLAAATVSADHPLLGRALVGGGLDFRLGLWSSRFALRLGADLLRGSAKRVGSLCIGFVLPGECDPQSLRDEARLSSGTAGVIASMFRTQHADLALTGELALADIRVVTRGLERDGMLIARKTPMAGARAGVDVAWTPARRVPVSLNVSGAIGVLAPIWEERRGDVYSPFEHSIGIKRVSVGLSWRPRRR